MKKNILMAIAILFVSECFAQIELAMPKYKWQPSVPQFDSIQGFVKQDNVEDYKKYVGQDVFFLPRNPTSSFAKKYYEDFFVCSPKGKTMPYKGKKGMTPAHEIDGKTFTIVDVNTSTDLYHKTDVYFTLKNKALNDSCIWKIPVPQLIFTNNALSVGQLQKLKEKHVGISYVFQNIPHGAVIKDLKTNLPIQVDTATLFTCDKVEIMPWDETSEFMEPCLIFKSADNYIKVKSLDAGKNFVSLAELAKEQLRREAQEKINNDETLFRQTDGLSPYDSVQSLCWDNITSHTGQILFLVGNSYHKESDGFSYFLYTKPTFSLSEHKDENIYKPYTTYSELGLGFQSSHVSTCCDSVIDKQYKVLGVAAKKDRPSQEIIYCLKLVEVSSNEVVYARITRTGTECNNFVTLGYLEKLKLDMTGRDFYTFGDFQYDLVGSDKKEQKLPFKSKFRCIDVVLNTGNYYRVAAILTNSTYGKIKSDITKDNSIVGLIDILNYNSLAKKYGATYANLIIRGKVQIGMTSKMCKEAWGEPETINYTTGAWGTHEQWVYGDGNYLYFENGRLSTIQN